MSVFYAAAGLPALVSTGITILYFFLKACSYVFNAISHQTKRRVAAATTGGGQQEHCANTGEEGHTEICQTNTRKSFRTIWRKVRTDPQGPFFYQEGGKTYASLPVRDDTRHTAEPAFRENAKGLQSRRHQTPKKHYGKGPEDSCANATGIFTKHVEAGTNASDEQSQCAEGNG